MINTAKNYIENDIEFSISIRRNFPVFNTKLYRFTVVLTSLNNNRITLKECPGYCELKLQRKYIMEHAV